MPQGESGSAGASPSRQASPPRSKDADLGIVADHHAHDSRAAVLARHLHVSADQTVGQPAFQVQDTAVLEQDAVLDLALTDRNAVAERGVRPDEGVLD